MTGLPGRNDEARMPNPAGNSRAPSPKFVFPPSSRGHPGIPPGIVPQASSSRAPRGSPIYLLPTRACVPLGAVLLAAAYAAVSQNNAGAYLLGFFLVSLGIVAMVHTHFALTGLRARVGRIPPAFAGGEARVPVFLENGSRRARRAIFRVGRAREWRWPWQRASSKDEPPQAAVMTDVPLPAGGTAELLLVLPVARRGREPFGRLVVSTRYPLGFSRGLFFEAMQDVELLVYPAPAGKRSLPAPPPAGAGADPLTADHRGDEETGDDYRGSRLYRPGDSQRHVDWRAAARGTGGGGGGGPLLVKQFAGIARQTLVLDWTMADGPGMDGEARLSQLCRWLLDAENNDDLFYGLRLPGGFALPPGRGDAHLHRGLRALALHDAGASPTVTPG